jgi:parallel beta-helix repeat protein
MATVALVTVESMPAQAEGRATPIRSCGAVLSNPGNYVLARDLSCGLPEGGAAIQILANDVRLNLAGHTLSGTGDGIGILVGNSPTSGVKVFGGMVAGFDAAVVLRDATDAHVVGMTATGNERPFQCLNSPSVIFRGNLATGSLFSGFTTSNCDQSRFVGNEASGNQQSGFTMNRSSGGLFSGNTSRDNGGNGLFINDTDTDPTDLQATFIGNVFTGNGNVGLAVRDAASGGRFIGNIVTGNQPRDIEASVEPCDNLFRGNVFGTDNETGPDAGPGAGCIQ